MHISKISAAIHVGTIYIEDISLKKLRCDYNPSLTKSQLKDNSSRVYFIVVDGKIEKIGSSNDQGGIKGTINGYLAGCTGNPSERSYGGNNFMFIHLNNKKQVKFYYMVMPKVNVNLTGITGDINQNFSIDPRNYESALIQQYYDVEKKYPFLNLQERHEKWNNVILDGKKLVDDGYFKLKNKQKR
jgi:hypothetical protein